MFNSNPCLKAQEGSDFNVEAAFSQIIANPTHQSFSRQFLHLILAQNLIVLQILQRNQTKLNLDLNQTRQFESTASTHVPRQASIERLEKRMGNILEQFNDGESSNSNILSRNNKNQKSSESDLSNGSPKKVTKVYFDADASSSDKEGKTKMGKPKQAESKNMIKNMAKGIFNFIRKQPKFRNKILQKLGIEEDIFMKSYAQLKGNVRTISELRGIWTDANPFCRAFRMLSYEYLRKHSLPKTFNSRITNYSLHLKYRHRLLEAIGNPQDFLALKMD